MYLRYYCIVKCIYFPINFTELIRLVHDYTKLSQKCAKACCEIIICEINNEDNALIFNGDSLLASFKEQSCIVINLT